MRILFCGAIENEIFLLKKAGFDIFLVGIGAIEAGIRLSEKLAREKYDKIIFLGTAGAYKNSDLVIGDLISANSTIFVSGTHLLGKAYFPELFKKEIQIESTYFDFPQKKVATVMEITKNDELAEKISLEYSLEVEHMEIFSLARVCERKNIEFSAYLGIANFVGKDSHKEWLENNEKVAENLQKYLLKHSNILIKND
jgi:nucleoside phosphorylase